jgi:hypothetical protein
MSVSVLEAHLLWEAEITNVLRSVKTHLSIYVGECKLLFKKVNETMLVLFKIKVCFRILGLLLYFLSS